MRKTISIVAAMLLSVLLHGGCTQEESHKQEHHDEVHDAKTDGIIVPAALQKEVGLTVGNVEEQAVGAVLTFPARLRPNQDLEAHVGSFLQGRVHSVAVSVGQRVRRGQELMQIEGLEIGTIKADFLKAKANFEYARATLERQKSLAEQNVGSRKALLEAQAEYDKALAEFNGEDRKIHSIGLTDEDVTRFIDDGNGGNGHSGGILPIKSPIDGVVVERTVVIGQLVDQTTTAFCVMNTSELWADAQVYERDLPALQGIVAASLTFTAFPGEEFPASIQNIGVTVDEKTRTITVRAHVPNPARKLKPEMYGELRLRISAPSRRILVPTESLVRERGQFSVFIAQSDSTFVLRPVRTGITVGGSTEILSGVRPGERMVLTGGFYLKSELLKESISHEGH